MALAAISAATIATPAVVWFLLGAPITEELVFRAGIQDALARWVRPSLAVFAGSLLFAAAHAVTAHGALAALTFFPSLVLGTAYAFSGRLRIAVALHAFFNAVWLFGGQRVLLQFFS